MSFDGNYRAKLGPPGTAIRKRYCARLIAETDLAFADHRDIAMVLGEEAESDSENPQARFGAAAQRAFAAFPNLQRLASTIRSQHSVDSHGLGALMATRAGALLRVPDVAISGIVDRIGAGDAFAAGVLHGLLSGMGDADSLHFGLAAACLKHSVPGDFNLVVPMK